MGDIINMFPNKTGGKQVDREGEPELKSHFATFLATLDDSLSTFHTLNAHEKYSLYKTLVEFTHVSLDSYLKLKGEE